MVNLKLAEDVDREYGDLIKRRDRLQRELDEAIAAAGRAATAAASRSGSSWRTSTPDPRRPASEGPMTEEKAKILNKVSPLPRPMTAEEREHESVTAKVRRLKAEHEQVLADIRARRAAAGRATLEANRPALVALTTAAAIALAREVEAEAALLIAVTRLGVAQAPRVDVDRLRARVEPLLAWLADGWVSPSDLPPAVRELVGEQSPLFHRQGRQVASR